MRNKLELFKRYGFFFLGIISNAIGVAFITRSNLGAGPTTCIPYVISCIPALSNLKVPLTYGTINFLFCIFLLLLQLVILRKDFNKRQWLQIPVVLLFSVLLDVAMKLTANINLNLYVYAILWTLLGCVLRAFGVSCQVLADVVMLSPEAFVKAVSDVSKKEFSVWKLILDAIMVVIAIVISYFCLHNAFYGVREGTLISVILIGPISHFFTKKMGFATHYFENEGEFVYESKLQVKEGKRLVVTISSESGSGGREIARQLANKLNIPVYDKELIDLIAEKGSFDKNFVKRHDEKLYVNFAHAVLFENYTFGDRKIDSYRKLFNVQSSVIRELAETQDCIIIGHCANYILKDYAEPIHLFVYSSLKEVTDAHHFIDFLHMHHLPIFDKKHQLEDTDDVAYSEYYRHFTGKDWKDAGNYHVTLDSSLFGIDGTTELIEDILKKTYIDKPKFKMRHALLGKNQ